MNYQQQQETQQEEQTPMNDQRQPEEQQEEQTPMAVPTRVNGVGLWNSWKRNFRTPLLAFLDIMDNAVDAADVNSSTGKIHIGADRGTARCPTGVILINNSQHPIKDLTQILEVYHSTKHNNAESVGENGVGLKQGCAALANLSFVVVRRHDDLYLGILSRHLQTPEGCCLPSWHLGKVSATVGGQPTLPLIRALAARDEAVSYCLREYGGDHLDIGIQRLALRLDHILTDPVWMQEPHVFLLILNQLVHTQYNHLKHPTLAVATGQNPGDGDVDSASPDARYVRQFLQEVAEVLPRQYIHIPSSFHLLVDGKPLQFEYWPRRLVEMTHFTLPIVRDQHYMNDPNFNRTAHRDPKTWYYLNVYMGFDARRATLKNKNMAQLHVYSRASGRLICCVDDARSQLMLTVGGSTFCQGLTVIVDDLGGELPLNPTKQDLAFGEEEHGDSHKKNLFAWLGGATWLYWHKNHDACGARKEVLSERIQKAYEGNMARFASAPPPIHKSQFTRFVPPQGPTSWKIKQKVKIQPEDRYKFVLQEGPHTLFRIQRIVPSPIKSSKASAGNEETTEKKRKRKSTDGGSTDGGATTDILNRLVAEPPRAAAAAAAVQVREQARAEVRAPTTTARASSTDASVKWKQRAEDRGRRIRELEDELRKYKDAQQQANATASPVAHPPRPIQVTQPSPAPPVDWEKERESLKAELAAAREALSRAVEQKKTVSPEHTSQINKYKKHYLMEKTERKAMAAQNEALQNQVKSLTEQLDLAKAREAPTSPLPSDEEW